MDREQIIKTLAADIQRQCSSGGYCSGDLYLNFDVGVYDMTIDTSIDLGDLADAVLKLS